MAVQAQYPSNFLFLNRNVQEEKPQIGGDYTHNQQSQAGEGFIEQSPLIFPNGVEANRRKRAREMVSNSSSPISPFSLHPHPSQFVDLRLAFGEQQKQQQQSMSSQSSAMYSVLSEDLTAQIMQQRDEIQQFLHAQEEQMRRTLAEKRQRHYNALLVAAEESVSRRLNEKEIEMARAAQRGAELEAQANRLAAEARAWQARARAGEATAAALQAQLQQAVMSNGMHAQVPEEMGGDTEVEDNGSAYVDPDRVVMVGTNDTGCSGPICKACRKGVASVVLLPCRHLSICTDCDRSITNQACPVCFSFKESSVEVYLA